MVAYSFRPQFVEPIRTGAKRHTIRADRKRHARPGEELQLYTGMRTPNCFLIARATCLTVGAIRLHLADGIVDFGGAEISNPYALDLFACRDGFRDFDELRAFWRVTHPGLDPFSGVIVVWGGITPG